MYSLCLLTAVSMTAAVDPQIGGGCNCGSAPGPQPAGITYIAPAPAATGLGSRVRNWLGAAPQGSPYHAITYGQPAAEEQVTIQTVAPPEATVVTVQRPNFQVTRKNEDKVGHDENYAWITGQLFYVHADGGKWVLRYSHVDEVDKFGGSVVLAPTVEMRNYREGDVVCVYGQVMDEGRATRSLGGASYRVSSISMVERADP
jgi:hypothetical protein